MLSCGWGGVDGPAGSWDGPVGPGVKGAVGGGCRVACASSPSSFAQLPTTTSSTTTANSTPQTCPPCPCGLCSPLGGSAACPRRPRRRITYQLVAMDGLHIPDGATHPRQGNIRAACALSGRF